MVIGGKIPIRIHPMFWLLVALISWLNAGSWIGAGIWAVVIFLSVLIHEFGHAITAVAFGQEAEIHLVGFGGLTQKRGEKLPLWKEFVIVLNGPLAGFLLFCVSYSLSTLGQNALGPLFYHALTITWIVNLFWTVLNLLPIQPLDGGRLLVIIFQGMFGLRGLQVAFFISIVLGALMSGFFFTLRTIPALIVGALFLLLTLESFRAFRSSLGMTEQDQDAQVQTLFDEAEKHYRQGDREEALHRLRRVREQSKAGVIYHLATEYLADLLNKEGRIREAYHILDPLRGKLSPEALRLLHQLAFRNEQWNDAIALGNQTFQNYPDYDTALINALSHSLLGEARPAIGWLQCAIKEGLPNVPEILQKREFDNIRSDPSFRDLS